jgi:nucleotide-binding universal stress UspA family protein
MERFAVGIDGSPGSEDALRWALRESRTRDATLTAVLVWDFLDQYHADGSRTFDPRYHEHAARRASMSRSSARWAAREACLRGATRRVVHACAVPYAGAPDVVVPG